MKNQIAVTNSKTQLLRLYKTEVALLVALFITVFWFDQGVAILKPFIGTPKSNVQMWNLAELFFQHVVIVLIATTASLILAFGLASWVHIKRYGQLKSNLLSFCGFGETFPTAALIALLVPLLGYGMESVIIALFVYGLMPIFTNTIEGLESIPKQISEAADGMGFTPTQKYGYVELRMGMPYILAGIRISLIVNIAAATIGAVVGAGGLGMPIMSGIRIYDPILIMKGALPVILLALLVDGLFRKLEKHYGQWSVQLTQ
jgi:osmoprotectant transport system permease protein